LKLGELLKGDSKMSALLVEADGSMKQLVLPNGDKLPHL